MLILDKKYSIAGILTIFVFHLFFDLRHFLPYGMQ